MCGKKKGNRRHTTLSLLNADAKALCLRPDPELCQGALPSVYETLGAFLFARLQGR